MRDVRHFVKTETQSYYWDSLSTTPAVNTAPRELIRTQRSDAVSTGRLPDGSYGFPTLYESFFGQTTGGGPGDARWLATSAKRLRICVWSDGFDNGDLYHGTVGLKPNVSSATINRALNRALGAIKANDLNLAVAVGEIRSSVATITTLLSAAARYFREAMPMFATGRPWRRGSLAQNFLALQYGVMPLMQDIYTATQIIDNGLSRPMCHVKVVQPDDSYVLPPATLRRTYSGSALRGCEVGYTFGLLQPELFTASRYGLTDPLGLLWELTAYSFVVDWFLHVGDFLSGLSGPLGLLYTSGYRTLYLNNDFVREDRWHDTLEEGAKAVIKPGWSQCYIRARSMSRTPLMTFTGPKPYLDLELNLDQALSAIALIASFRP